MDLITIGTTAAIAVPTIAAVALYMDRRTLRKRLSVLKERVDFAQDLNIALRERRDKLECQAASDGNRLSELRVQNGDLARQRDEAIEVRDKAVERERELLNQLHSTTAKLSAAEAAVTRLQPLADKALATQAQRAAALEKANAANRAAKARRSQAA